MIVTGFGSTVCIACSLVEVLKRNQMAVICHIETKLDSPINYININERYNNLQQQQYYKSIQQTAIEFHLLVGKYGNYLSGYHQRKVHYTTNICSLSLNYYNCIQPHADYRAV